MLDQREGSAALASGRSRMDRYGCDSIPAFRGMQPLTCARDGSRVTTRFPHRCPLATARPLRTIGRLQALAWAKLGTIVPPDLSDGLAFMGWSDVCFGCIADHSAHPAVRRLRWEAGNAE